jgi:hypothetical protein
MLKQRIFRQLIITFVIALSFFQIARANAIEVPEDIKGWYSNDEYVVIDQDTTWDKDMVFTDPNKDIVVVDGATLTIEKGVHIELASRLNVYLGRIVVNGKAEDNVIFTKTALENLQFPDGYDSSYGYPVFGMINFEDSSWEYGAEPSIMRFTQFDGLGMASGGGPIMVMNNTESLFFPVAQAAELNFDENSFYTTFPAIKLTRGRLRIENSSFINNQSVDIMVDANRDFSAPRSGSLEVVNSNFEGNQQNVALLSRARVYYWDDYWGSSVFADNGAVKFTNNWYGNESGPIADSNPSGSGEELLGVYTLNGWSATKHENTISGGPSNVLFLPGIKTSRLYKSGALGTEDQLWPPNYFGNDLQDLALDENGNSQNEVYTRDILTETPTGGNLYKTFLDQLATLKSEKTINDYKAFPYDWRESVEDIAKYGTMNESLEMNSLLDTIKSLSETSKSKKVTIVAHSNGGLVAKAVMLELEKQGLAEKVDKIIFVGTPQLGTPLSVLTLLYGYDEESTFLQGLISREDARTLSENMPGAYGLLPSDEYFSRMEKPFITFSSEQTRYKSFKNAYGSDVDNFSEFKNFLLGMDDKRSKPNSSDVEAENILNENILGDASAIHGRLDAWTPPASVQVIQLAGWGLDTISGVEYSEKEKVVCSSGGREIPVCVRSGEYEPIYDPQWTVDGDKVVTTSSALMLSEVENVKRYWINLYEHNDNNIPDREHKSLLEVADVGKFILDNLKNNPETSLEEFIKASRPDDYVDAKPRLRASLYSPLDINLYDDVGNHTGPAGKDENGQTIFEENIPNSYYYQFGERKYVGFPSGEKIRIEMDGYALGSYTLKLEEIKLTETGEETAAHTVFENLPTTADTMVKLEIPETGIAKALPLQADVDGDGANDYLVESVPNGTAILDITPPEAVIKFDPGTQKLDIGGVDDVSQTVSVAIATQPIVKKFNLHGKKIQKWFSDWRKRDRKYDLRNTLVATLIDEAGNTTNVVFEKTRDSKNRIFAEIKSVAYNGVETAINKTTLQYKWQTDHKGQYRQMATHLRTDTTSVEAHYLPKKNETWLMEKPRELRDDESDDDSEKRPTQIKLSGIVVPRMSTEKGIIKISY